MRQGRGLVLVLVATRSSGDCVEQTGRTPTRTSTRPPHPLPPAPCPYRTLGRKHLNGYDSPIRSSTFIRAGPCWWFVVWKCLVACLFLEESQQPTCPHSRQRRRCTLILPLCGVAGRWTLITEPRDSALPHLGPQEGSRSAVNRSFFCNYACSGGTRRAGLLL